MTGLSSKAIMDLIKQIEQNALPSLKEMSLQSFKEQGIPSTKNEYYKYTQVADLYQGLKNNFKTPELIFTGANIQVKEITDLKDYQAFFNKDLKDFTYDSLVHLTHGLTQKIYEVKIHESSTTPIVLDHTQASNSASTVIIRVKKNVNAVLFERFLSDQEGLRHNTTKILVEAGAKLEHITLQDNDFKFSQFNHIHLDVKKDGQYKNLNYQFGGHISRSNIHARLLEPGSECWIHGLHLGQESQHIDTLSFIEHLAPHTNSHQLYKSVLDDESRSAFVGRVKVHSKAQLINSEQLNKNLLLSKKARAHSLPQLEIFADDVKCAHGSTTGQLSEEELFYFTARGISEKRARKLMALGFANDVIYKCSDLNIRKNLEEKFVHSFKDRV